MNLLFFIPKQIFDIPLMSWIMTTVTIVASYAAMHLVILHFRKTLATEPPSSEKVSHFYNLIPQILGNTNKAMLAFNSILIGLVVLDLPPRWSEHVDHLWFLGLGLQLALWLNKLILVASKHYFISLSPNGFDTPSVSKAVFTWALQSFMWVVFVLAILSNLGINISALITSLGIGGVAFAIAIQSVLGDLFASLSIAIDKPFEVGDTIDVNGLGLLGIVENVGLKTTRLRAVSGAVSGEQIVVANSDLLKKMIRNYKQLKNRRIQFSVKVSSETSPEDATTVPGLLRFIIERHNNVQFDRAHLKSFDRTSIEFEIVYFVLNSDYNVYMDIQQAINLAIMYELCSARISFSEPVQKYRLVGDKNRLESTSKSAKNL